MINQVEMCRNKVIAITEAIATDSRIDNSDLSEANSNMVDMVVSKLAGIRKVQIAPQF